MSETGDGWNKNVDDIEAGEDDEPDESEFEIVSYPADIDLQSFVRQRREEQIIIPKFQRNFVWNQVQASKLIESFLLGLPVPGVFLYKPKGGTHLWVIDGQQRIEAIVKYFSNTFRNRKFSLVNVRRKWAGKSYKDLDDDEQLELSRRIMRATIVQQLSPADHSSVYQIYERLNAGTVKLTPMEVRLCIDDGKFTELLQELNGVDIWRKLIKQQKENLRAKDIEWILRVMALSDLYESYEKPMKKFLTDYLREHRNPEDTWLENKKKLFISAISDADRHLGNAPFHLRDRLNYSLLDSILVALMLSERRDKSGLRSAYDALVENPEYQNAVRRSTSDKREVTIRIRLATEILGKQT